MRGYFSILRSALVLFYLHSVSNDNTMTRQRSQKHILQSSFDELCVIWIFRDSIPVEKEGF